jgi:hypothetical protein
MPAKDDNGPARTDLMLPTLSASAPGAPGADVRERLIEHARPEIDALENLIGRGLSAWKRSSAPHTTRAA